MVEALWVFRLEGPGEASGRCAMYFCNVDLQNSSLPTSLGMPPYFGLGDRPWHKFGYLEAQFYGEFRNSIRPGLPVSGKWTDMWGVWQWTRLSRWQPRNAWTENEADSPPEVTRATTYLDLMIADNLYTASSLQTRDFSACFEHVTHYSNEDIKYGCKFEIYMKFCAVSGVSQAKICIPLLEKQHPSSDKHASRRTRVFLFFMRQDTHWSTMVVDFMNMTGEL